MADRIFEIKGTVPFPSRPTLSIVAADGRDLLVIHPDGSVTGELEDASEAAALFVNELRGMLPLASEQVDRAKMAEEAAAKRMFGVQP